jgi:preprotein translocase subunit YajC
MPSAAHATILISAAKSTPTSSSSGNIVFFLVLIVVFFFIYRFFMRPRQRAAQTQRDTLMTLEPGDEVLTGAGIFGTVQHIQGDRVTLWTGTGSTITVLRRTIARKLDEDDVEEGASKDHDADHHDTWDDDDAAELERAGNDQADNGADSHADNGADSHADNGADSHADTETDGAADHLTELDSDHHPAAGLIDDSDPTAATGTTTGTTDAPEIDGHVADRSSAENHTKDEER